MPKPSEILVWIRRGQSGANSSRRSGRASGEYLESMKKGVERLFPVSFVL
jgi:hypothetical protein